MSKYIMDFNSYYSKNWMDNQGKRGMGIETHMENKNSHIYNVR